MNPLQTDWLAKWAKYTPKRMAIREQTRDLEWNYADMNARCDALARWLTEDQGLKKGDRLAVYSSNNAEYVFVFFACVKSGIILVPLNFRLTPAELNVLLADSDPALLLYESQFEQQAASIETVQHTKRMALDRVTPYLTDKLPGTHFEAPSIGAADVVMILYTSGTTGLPKGAMITHKMLYWNSVNTALRLDITSADHTQSYAPFFHTGGWNVLLTPFIHHGASHTILSGFEPDLILELMQKEKTTLLFGVPTMMQMLADCPGFESADLSKVRYAIVGGAPMPLKLINTWHEKGIPIRQGYGLTEVGPNCFSLHQDDAVRKRGSIGFPNFYIDARSVTADGSDAAVNEVGELWLRSPVVTPGYWNKPEETAAAKSGDWFRTGDMVRVDEQGFYYVVDRKKNMFISGGENVYPAEIERFLDAIDGVRESAVIGVADEKWGEVGKAFIVSAGENIAEERVRSACSGNLAKYKIPKYFVMIEALPRNDAGKIDRLQLKKIHDENL